MPWTREEKIFCVTTYLQTKSFKTVLAKLRKKFNFNDYPHKSDLYLGTQIWSNRVGKQPQQEIRKSEIWLEVNWKLSW